MKSIKHKSKNLIYGHCYDRQGNLKIVAAPVQSGVLIKKSIKSLTGGLHDSVGFSQTRKTSKNPQ